MGCLNISGRSVEAETRDGAPPRPERLADHADGVNEQDCALEILHRPHEPTEVVAGQRFVRVEVGGVDGLQPQKESVWYRHVDLSGGRRPTAMMGVTAAAAAATGHHHARLGGDLHGAVDLEGAVGYDFIALPETLTDDVEVTGSWAEHDLAAFEGRLLGVRDLEVDDGTSTGHENRSLRHHERLFIRGRVADDAEVLGANEVHAADVADPRLVLDHLRMHRADPLTRKLVGKHGPTCGDPRAGDGRRKHARLEPAVAVVDRHPDGGRSRVVVDDRLNEGDPPIEGLAGVSLHGERHVLSPAQQREL